MLLSGVVALIVSTAVLEARGVDLVHSGGRDVKVQAVGDTLLSVRWLIEVCEPDVGRAHVDREFRNALAPVDRAICAVVHRRECTGLVGVGTVAGVDGDTAPACLSWLQLGLQLVVLDDLAELAVRQSTGNEQACLAIVLEKSQPIGVLAPLQAQRLLDVGVDRLLRNRIMGRR